MALVEQPKPDTSKLRMRQNSPPCWKCEFYLPDLTRGCWGCRHPENIGGLTDVVDCDTMEGHCEGFRYRSVLIDEEAWRNICESD